MHEHDTASASSQDGAREAKAVAFGEAKALVRISMRDKACPGGEAEKDRDKAKNVFPPTPNSGSCPCRSVSDCAKIVFQLPQYDGADDDVTV